ncbi:MAG: Rrf2 family transcriptional regulator [Acetobacter sp.]|jgi:Rrf2 family protein|nr:Rrf2 family transcriptional regulator [Acetobacter sp.]MCH4060984.1 Rrf2 family transcriptional regulator [Acetobacter sp.]MCH4087924.1 Rrf2 family transcriptional regulator [Acetobacter sp.]MCI1293460.1 Rrf2 family transcriptional regulator [Acetobacter sp.]MCI1319744.1 Rrf2 family transcriptional regulator [Acetobacter sp.]
MLFRRDRVLVAVSIMADVAFYAGRSGTVSAADIAQRAGMARRGIEPLLQALARSSLLESVRGPRGGYRLGRLRRDISLSDIVEVAAATDTPSEDGVDSPLFSKVIDVVWEAEDSRARERLREISLDDLVRKAEERGLRRPLAEPITFSI